MELGLAETIRCAMTRLGRMTRVAIVARVMAASVPVTTGCVRELERPITALALERMMQVAVALSIRL